MFGETVVESTLGLAIVKEVTVGTSDAVDEVKRDAREPADRCSDSQWDGKSIGHRSTSLYMNALKLTYLWCLAFHDHELPTPGHLTLHSLILTNTPIGAESWNIKYTGLSNNQYLHCIDPRVNFTQPRNLRGSKKRA